MVIVMVTIDHCDEGGVYIMYFCACTCICPPKIVYFGANRRLHHDFNLISKLKTFLSATQAFVSTSFHRWRAFMELTLPTCTLTAHMA